MHDDGLVAPDMNPVDTLMRKRKKKRKKKRKAKCNFDSEFEDGMLTFLASRTVSPAPFFRGR